MQMIYALIAMSFIRPAEKYLRELFGMDKGIAGAGSYDSGVAPIKAAAQAAMAVASVAADVVAPGAGAAIRGATSAVSSIEETSSEDGAELPADNIDDYDAVDAATNEQAMKNYLNEGGRQNTSGHYFNPYTDEFDPNYDPTKDEAYNDSLKEAKGDLNGVIGSGGNNGNALNASNVTINASNLDIKGIGSGVSSLASKRDSDKGADGEIVKGTLPVDNKTSKNNNGTDDNFGITDGKGGGNNGHWYDYLTGKSAARQLGVANGLLTGKRSIVDAVSAPYEWIGEKTGLSGGKFASKMGKIKDFAKRFEAAGGFTEIYKGVNSVRDTMFINGAPQDWKSTAAQMDENKKRRDEKAIYNFSRNEGNKNYMLSPNGGNLLAKYQDIYKDKSPEYQRHMAELEAEKKLESMAKAFVPYGITDVSLANSLKKDQTKYGYSAEEAIKQAAKFQRFNLNAGNISVVNNAYGKNTNTPVSVKIPDAKDYFNRGINDIGTMIQADKIAVQLSQKLGDRLSEQMRKDISTAIAKKGGVSYSGSNDEIRKIIDQLNKKG